MTWFIFALICIFGWGSADLFYKKGSDGADPCSHLKTAVWVGLVMGVSSLILLPFSESGGNFETLLSNAVSYLPASLGYIISMVIGYAGLRYLELSIVSPVQNASGALSVVVMAVWFTVRGNASAVMEEFSLLDIAGTILIVAGVISLAFVEQKISEGGIQNEAADRIISDNHKISENFRTGALALIFPVLYCVFDTIGTAADGIILDEEYGLGLGEIDVLVLYGLTFFAAGIVCFIIICIKEKKIYNPFKAGERPKALAAVCEEFGQVFYVYAMAGNPILAAPMVASYCVISAAAAGIFLKEKLKAQQYICIGLVIAGIILLGISEGLQNI